MVKPTGDPQRDIFDALMSQVLDVFRYTAYERAAMVARLEVLSQQLADQLNKHDLTDVKKSEVNKVIEKAQQAIDDFYTVQAAAVDFPALASTVISGTRDSLASAIKIVLGPTPIEVVSPQWIDAVASNVLIEGAPSAEWWKAQAESTQRKFAANVRDGLFQDETNQQIIRRIVGSSTQGGVMDVVRRDAAALVQTSVQTVANAARKETFNNNSDIILGTRQVSTLDNKTTLICIAYDGQVWNLEGVPIKGSILPYLGGVPRHWNCRSIEIPILKLIDSFLPKNLPVGTRASMYGQVPGDYTFGDFLKRRNQGWQNEALGKGRADMWRSGKITLQELVGGDGNSLTLDALRAKYGG